MPCHAMACYAVWCDVIVLNGEAIYQFSIVKTSNAQKLFLLSKFDFNEMKRNEMMKRNKTYVDSSGGYMAMHTYYDCGSVCVCWNIEGNRIRILEVFEMENGCVFTSTTESHFISCVRRMGKNEKHHHLVIFLVNIFPMICFFVDFTDCFPHSHSNFT